MWLPWRWSSLALPETAIRSSPVHGPKVITTCQGAACQRLLTPVRPRASLHGHAGARPCSPGCLPSFQMVSCMPVAVHWLLCLLNFRRLKLCTCHFTPDQVLSCGTNKLELEPLAAAQTEATRMAHEIENTRVIRAGGPLLPGRCCMLSELRRWGADRQEARPISATPWPCGVTCQ